MLVRNINGLTNQEWHRYDVNLMYPSKLLIGDEDGVLKEVTVFSARRYWRDNKGDWKPCLTNTELFITAETLMNKFVAIDSDIENNLQKLIDFKKQTQEKNLQYLDQFSFNDKVDVESNDELVTNLDVVNNLDVIDNTFVPSAEK